MNRRTLFAALMMVCPLAGPSSADPPEAVVGKPAPRLGLVDVTGRHESLDAYRGRAIVIEWTNPECPYVRKHYDSGNMQALQREARGAGVVWLTVSSAAAGNVGYLDELEAQAWLDERKAAPTRFLLDRDGAAMQRYGVSVALTLFVIDAKGGLAYAGAIDDRPTARPEDVQGATNYVRGALAALARGEAPKPAQTRPYGCVAR
jgi:peroxiredoxin